MPTPRDHALSIGGAERAKLGSNEGTDSNPRGKDPGYDVPERERQLFNEKPAQVPPKPFR